MKKIVRILFLLFTLSLTTQCLAASTYLNERDYLTLPSIPIIQNAMPKDKVTVIEFFSYGCPSCYKLEPALQKWLAQQPSYVNFYRIPVTFQDNWDLYAKAFYIAQELNLLDKITPAVFDIVVNNGVRMTPEMMANVFAKYGVDKQKFLDMYNTSMDINAKVSSGRSYTNNLMVFQVPGFVVDGKYKVDTSFAGASPSQLFAITNYLIEKVAHEKKLTNPKAAVVSPDDQTHTG